MTAHDPRLTMPTAYSVAYACTCGWSSDEVDSEQLATIGRQLVRHMQDTGKERRS